VPLFNGDPGDDLELPEGLIDLLVLPGDLEGEEYLDLVLDVGLLIPNRYLIRRLYCMRFRLGWGGERGRGIVRRS
jgi:hypothetical protein